MADTKFTQSLKMGLVDALGSAVPVLLGSITSSNIILEKFMLKAPGRMLVSGTLRQLAVAKLVVDYSFLIPEDILLSPEALGAALVKQKETFEIVMKMRYPKHYKAYKGEAPNDFTGILASEATGIRFVKVARTTTTTTTPTTTTTSTTTTTTTPNSTTPTTTTTTVEEDISGIIRQIAGIGISVILGIAITSCILRLCKHRRALKQQQQHELRQKMEDEDIREDFLVPMGQEVRKNFLFHDIYLEEEESDDARQSGVLDERPEEIAGAVGDVEENELAHGEQEAEEDFFDGESSPGEEEEDCMPEVPDESDLELPPPLCRQRDMDKQEMAMEALIQTTLRREPD
eukprot:gnl/MRDRNA2_/MRDRNA2_71279_c0_seq1.p1 gnl/MRDRNA2_/MRDRNA2_71279_c0~~gnl/MRDRNA2_/MRDRNA2_71279_c0_seq1.p1  ORF type:complete len:405 (-),score=86.92 gnl/MRDRNA2_/MRDRNA2_71279_c0_seq1:478-1512(-)